MNRRTSALTLLGIAPLLGGCVSEAQMRIAVEERDREIAALREEKIELQERLDLLAYDNQDLTAKLESAEARTTPAPATEEASATIPTLAPFPELDEAGVEYGLRGDSIVFSLPSEITFPSGKATLSSEGRAALAKVADRLRSEFPEDARFFVEGHTDSDPIRRSSFASNRALSLARAMAVLEYLVTDGRVPDDRFVVVGHGQYSPRDTNDTKDGKARNRRVEIVVHSAEG